MGKAARNRAIHKAAGGNKSIARKMRKYMKFMKQRGVKIKWL